MKARTIGKGLNPEVKMSGDVSADFTGFTIFEMRAFFLRQLQNLRNGSGSRKGQRLVIGA
jgi:hypothetical protein